MPDIDIDFCMRRRGELIEYVTQKYGRENVAQIITFGTMAAKAAVKDVGRAMDIPYGEVDRLAKLIPTTLGIELEDALKEVAAATGGGEQRSAAEGFDGGGVAARRLARHASTHAAGVVISPKPLTDLVPVYKTNRDEITTQYDMNALERIGLLKMDFLGLTDADGVARYGGDDPAESRRQDRSRRLTLDDGIRTSSSTRRYRRRSSSSSRTACATFCGAISRTRIEDLTALNALYRPGPIQGGMIDDFINRKHGKNEGRLRSAAAQRIFWKRPTASSCIRNR